MPAVPLIFSYELTELHRVSFRYHLLFSKTTSAQENVRVVQQMLAASGQGDLVAALDAYAEDVDF